MIKAAPPEMYRADFADEARAEFFEDLVDIHQRAPKSIRVLGVVGRVRFVFVEANRVRDLNRHRPNLDVDIQTFECRHHSLVKLSNRFRAQLENLDRAVTALYYQFVIDKVELDLEDA